MYSPQYTRRSSPCRKWSLTCPSRSKVSIDLSRIYDGDDEELRFLPKNLSSVSCNIAREGVRVGLHKISEVFTDPGSQIFLSRRGHPHRNILILDECRDDTRKHLLFVTVWIICFAFVENKCKCMLAMNINRVI